MGAGSICSNVKSDKKLVVVKDGEEKIETGVKKFGAMLGDHVEVGCGSVLNPGTVIGRNCNILSSFTGKRLHSCRQYLQKCSSDRSKRN